MNNARIIREGLQAAGITCYGGVDSPYIWLKTPGRPQQLGFLRQTAAGM